MAKILELLSVRGGQKALDKLMGKKKAVTVVLSQKKNGRAYLREIPKGTMADWDRIKV